MTKKPFDHASQQRFFRALVVMGSGIALGCGGSAERHLDDGPAAGTGGAGGQGGGAGAAQGGSTSKGGSISKGGSGGIAIGGAAGAPVEPDPMCPPAQWDCSSQGLQCAFDGRNGYQLPNGCKCDSSRPASAADCAPDQTFACHRGLVGRDGQPLDEARAFSCACFPDQASCYQTCQLALAIYDSACEETQVDGNPESVLCGCAVVVLL